MTEKTQHAANLIDSLSYNKGGTNSQLCQLDVFLCLSKTIVHFYLI